MDISMPEYVKNRFIGSNIINQKDPNIIHISGQSLIMEKDYRWYQIHMRAIFLTKNAQTESNRLWAPCYIMPGQWIQQCYRVSMKYHKSNQNQQIIARKRPKCY